MSWPRFLESFTYGADPVPRKYISKRITPHESTAAKPGNHHYCFVDFETAEEADAAMAATNGLSVPQYGGRLRVSPSTGMPAKLTSRRAGADGGGPRRDENRRDWRSDERGTAGTWDSRSQRSEGGAPSREGHSSSSRTDAAGGSTPQPQRALASGNWRRRDDAA